MGSLAERECRVFPLSSKKIARAINAASGNRPLVVLANLSLRRLTRVDAEFAARVRRRDWTSGCELRRSHSGGMIACTEPTSRAR